MQSPQQIDPSTLWQRIKCSWQPKSIERPTVDPDIEALDAVQRSAEAIRYSILNLEFWISPDGQVREWLKHNGRLSVWLAIPAFLILPVITFILGQFSEWFAILVNIAGRLIVLPILSLVAFMALLIVFRIIRLLK